MRAAAFCVAKTAIIRAAQSSADLNAVRSLCWAYRDYLLNFAPAEREMTEVFYPEAKYREVMTELPQLHARPRGIILLAEVEGTVVGCGMSHPLTDSVSEIKRLYVTDAARGTGAGKAICAALIQQARDDGFDQVMLDTSRSFAAARALYTRLGFAERGPYQPLPALAQDLVVFYELSLTAPAPVD